MYERRTIEKAFTRTNMLKIWEVTKRDLGETGATLIDPALVSKGSTL